MKKLIVLAMLLVAAMAQTQNISELWIPSGKQQVFGVLSKLENPKNARQPIVIIAHGFKPAEFQEELRVIEKLLKKK